MVGWCPIMAMRITLLVMMAVVRQDLQTKVTDAFVHLNTRAPTARKETVGKNTFFIW